MALLFNNCRSFIIVSEVLSLMIQRHIETKDLKGMKIARSAPILSHCFFADDAILFLSAEEINCQVLKRILDVYCTASGQLVNLAKSSVFFSANTPENVKEGVSACLGIQYSAISGNYLGLPLIWGRSKVAALAFVWDRIGMKLQGWRQRLLSFAGREVLMKAIANSIPTYPMTCFLFPKKACLEIDGLISSFWWGQDGESGAIHWKSWRNMTSQKSEGGMGFRDLLCFNKALLAKTAWRLITQPNDLWCKVLKGIYFPKTSFLHAKKGRRASWAWSSLQEGRNLLLEEFHWKLGNGRRVRVWKDSWVQNLPTRTLQASEELAADEQLRVADLIREGRWDLSVIDARISDDEKALILKMPVPNMRNPDRAVWLANRDGSYSVKSGYRVAKNSKAVVRLKDPGTSFSVPKRLWKCIWKVVVPPKIQHFLWRLGAGAMATQECLFKRKCSKNPLCPICLTESETIEHVLFLCPWTKHCWFGCPLGLSFNKWNMKRYELWLCDMLADESKLDSYGKALFATMCWFIWKKRCNWVFNGIRPDAREVVRIVNLQVEEFWKSKAKGQLMPRNNSLKGVTRHQLWLPPKADALKLNVDGAYDINSGEAGIGLICRDLHGRFVGSRAKSVEASSPFMAECAAMKEALLLRGKFDAQQVIIETDCEILYRLLLNRSLSGCEWKCWDLLQESYGLLDSVGGVSLSLVSRQGNNAADWLAAKASRKMYQHDWLEVAPFSLRTILSQDVMLAVKNCTDPSGVNARDGIG